VLKRERKEGKEKEQGSENMRGYTGARQPEEGSGADYFMGGKNLEIFTKTPIHKSHQQRAYSRITSFFATMPLFLSTPSACPSIVRPESAALDCAPPPPSPSLADTHALTLSPPLCSSAPTTSGET
jgi:hypothetical protein